MTDELESIWKGNGHGLIKERSQHLPRGTEEIKQETLIRIANVQAEIWTENLLNKS
jgi:hypothetical protein